MTPAVTFAAFAIAQQVSGGEQFGVAKAFTSLSLLAILIDPVAQLVMVATQLYSALSCADRIEEFLVQEKRDDFRNLNEQRQQTSTSSISELVAEDAATQKSEDDPAMDGLPLIHIRAANFGWTSDSSILQDISIDVFPSTLTMIVGLVGTGKSTLLNALLGETYISGGSVDVQAPGGIAYCGQDPWVLNKSIRDNIICIESFDQAFYDEVVRACQLTEDFDALQDGDQTEVGSQGGSLSGGQKQRIVSITDQNCGKLLID